MSSSDEPYWLGRASAEQQRLIKQHHVWTKSIGYLLHPSLARNLPRDARIADIGTGTGIWLTELSKVSPSTYQFNGFDISNEQFLPADTLPSNVSLDFGDFKKGFPEELHGTFDVVNIRLIIISMGKGVWEATLANVLPLLKPGGAISWTEGNFLVARGFRGSEPNSTGGHYLTRAQTQLNTTLRNRFGFNWPDWFSMYTEAGLERVEEDVSSTDRLVEQRRDFTDIGVGAVLGGLRNLASVKEKGGKEAEAYWSLQEVDEYRVKAQDDMESGAYLRWDLQVTVGFTKIGVGA